ncbi:MAG: flagellar protein [Chloroflexi bacterium]|nr:flagellar protein [Chloroflexota bacterium]
MAIDRIGGAANIATAPRLAAAKRPADSTFAGLLSRAGEGINLSRHAQKRIDRRDLNLDPARLDRLDSAISRAAEKGARQSVVMLDGLAVVVDVQQRTVVTAMNTGGGQQRVFTNVDSVVVA